MCLDSTYQLSIGNTHIFTIMYGYVHNGNSTNSTSACNVNGHIHLCLDGIYMYIVIINLCVNTM